MVMVRVRVIVMVMLIMMLMAMLMVLVMGMVMETVLLLPIFRIFGFFGSSECIERLSGSIMRDFLFLYTFYI